MATVLVALFVAGCLQTRITVQPLNPAPRPLTSRSVASVEVFHFAPQRDFVEIARITGRGNDGEGQLEATRQRAAELGCDGLVVLRDEAPREQQVSYQEGPIGAPQQARATVTEDGVIEATCIVYRVPDASGR